jgi:hypothetical protein
LEPWNNMEPWLARFIWNVGRYTIAILIGLGFLAMIVLIVYLYDRLSGSEEKKVQRAHKRFLRRIGYTGRKTTAPDTACIHLKNGGRIQIRR